MNNRTILVWFRNDLRIHDNEILVRASENGNRIVPVYCFDPWYYCTTKFGTRKTGILRASFIRENVIALRDMFRQAGGDLYIACGKPTDILPGLCRTFGVDEVYHHREVAHEETSISGAVEAVLWKQQINLRHFIGHTLYHKEDLPFPIRDIPDTFSVFRKKTERESFVRPQFPAPASMEFHPDLTETPVPDLSELGFSEAEIQTVGQLTFRGGEQAALRMMEQLVNDPDTFRQDSRLSPYIASGALSPNTLYHALMGSGFSSTHRKQLDIHLQRLLWRDYYRFMFKKHGNQFFHENGLAETPPERFPDDEAAFESWKNGRTGELVVDEGMQQLNQTGYIPHQIRAILASYLVHVLKVNWLKGAAWFEEKLIDYNPASNYGNWAHIAGVGSSLKDNKSFDIMKIIA